MGNKIISFSSDNIAKLHAYRLLISCIVPRPIAWVSTIGKDGTPNLAPFSFFGAVGESPPTIMVSIEKRGKEEKDTLRNARQTGEMVVHIVTESLMEKMVLTSGSWEYDVNEFEEAGLETEPSFEVAPFRIKDAPVSLEVKCIDIIPVNGTHSTMIIGRIVRFNIREDLLNDREVVDPGRLKPVARLGGSDYSKLGEVFSIGRP